MYISGKPYTYMLVLIEFMSKTILKLSASQHCHLTILAHSQILHYNLCTKTIRFFQTDYY